MEKVVDISASAGLMRKRYSNVKNSVKVRTTHCNEVNVVFACDSEAKNEFFCEKNVTKSAKLLTDRQFSREKIKNNQQKSSKRLPGRPFLGSKNSQKYNKNTPLFIKNLTENSYFFCNYAFAADFLGFSKSYIVALTAKRPYIFEKLLPEKLSTQVFLISRANSVELK